MPADSNPPGADRAPFEPRRIASGPGQLPQDDPPPTAARTPRRALPPQPDDSATAPGMGGAVGWTVLGTILPGLGLWRSGRRITGSLVMAVSILLVAGLAGFALTQRSSLLAIATNAEALRWTALALLVVAVAWVVVIGTTHLALRPAGASAGQRLLGAFVVGGLSFAIAAPLAMGANLAYSASGLAAVFTPDGENKSETLPTITNTVDPWAEKERLNVLVLGGDSGTGRDAKLGMRTDTVIVASIDTRTGSTTLFSLPRQTARMPFPKKSPLRQYYPNGFYDGSNPANAEYFLNAMYRNVPQRVPHDVLGDTKFFAADVMKISVGEALGLDIDYFVTVNMDGFKDIINALGGITVNVNYRVPIGGKSDEGVPPSDWIEPGPNQHFTGRKALWYARGRYGLDDYSRMERQRCVINAVVQQASPQNVLRNFEKIAAAGEKTIVTDVPSSMLPAMLELANRVQGTKLRSIVFINGKDGFRTGTPDWELVQKRVKTALKETAKSNPGEQTSATPSGASTSATPTSGPASGTPSATPTSAKPTKSPATKSPAAKPKSEDLASACAYDPKD